MYFVNYKVLGDPTFSFGHVFGKGGTAIAEKSFTHTLIPRQREYFQNLWLTSLSARKSREKKGTVHKNLLRIGQYE